MVLLRTRLTFGSGISTTTAKYDLCDSIHDMLMLTLKVSSLLLSAKVRPRFIDYEEMTGLLGHIFKEAVTSARNKAK